MEKSGGVERVPHSYDGTPDIFEGLPEELKELRVRFRVRMLIISRSSGCTVVPLTSHIIQITTPDDQDFIIGNARFVEWED